MSWAEYVKKDLKARLLARRDLPERLSLHGLSRFYSVSITPVRTAVGELVDEGVLRKNEKGRLAINSRRIGSHAQGPEMSRPEPPKDYFEIIASDLIVRSMQCSVGAEEKENVKPHLVREDDTAARHGISRSSVREVFHRLAGVGLLKHVPRCGWELRRFRKEDFEAYVRVREVLEVQALDEAWPHLVDEELRAILNRNVLPNTETDRPVSDNSIHTYFVEKAGNPYIRDFFNRHGRYYEVLFDWDTMDREVLIEAVEQHREIIVAVLKRDKRSAKSVLGRHIRHNYAALESLPPGGGVGDKHDHGPG